MTVTSDIFALWRRPAAVIRGKIDEGPREDKALIVLMAACVLLFVARWPALSRQAHLDLVALQNAGQPTDHLPSLQALMGINLFVMLFVAPLMFYALAAVPVPFLRMMGRKIAPYAARLALFWALLATAPLMLFQGLLAGLSGNGIGLSVVSYAIGIAFFWLWSRLLKEASAP